MKQQCMDPSAPPPSYDEVTGAGSAGFMQPPYPVNPTMPMPIHQQMPYPHTPLQTMPIQQISQPQNARYPRQPQQNRYAVTQVHIPMQQSVGAGTTTTVIINPVNVQLGPHSQFLTCPNCGKHSKTKIIVTNSVTTHIIAGILFVLGCFLCSCLPYCMDAFKTKNHYCSNCNAFLGTYSNMNGRR